MIVKGAEQENMRVYYNKFRAMGGLPGSLPEGRDVLDVKKTTKNFEGC